MPFDHQTPSALENSTLIFPNVETMELPPEAFCPVENLDRVMEKMAVWVKNLASTDEHGQAVYSLAPAGPTQPLT